MMNRPVLILLLLEAAALCSARPSPQTVDLFENDDQYFNKFKSPEINRDSPKLSPGGASEEYVNLLDGDKWKELLAQGKVRDMIDAIQRTLGSNRPVRMRSQMKTDQDLGYTIQNTVNWNAYKDDKTKLNLNLDSKFARSNGKVDMIDPSFGLSFQIKY